MDDPSAFEKARMILLFPSNCVATVFREWAGGRGN